MDYKIKSPDSSSLLALDSSSLVDEAFHRFQHTGEYIRATDVHTQEHIKLLDSYMNTADVLYTYYQNPTDVDEYFRIAIREADRDLRGYDIALPMRQETEQQAGITSGEVWKEFRSTVLAAMRWRELEGLKSKQLAQSLDYWDLRHQYRVSEAWRQSASGFVNQEVMNAVIRHLPDIENRGTKAIRERAWRWQRTNLIVAFFMVAITTGLLSYVAYWGKKAIDQSASVKEDLRKADTKNAALVAHVSGLEVQASQLEQELSGLTTKINEFNTEVRDVLKEAKDSNIELLNQFFMKSRNKLKIKADKSFVDTQLATKADK